MAVREKRSPLQSEIIRFIQNYISENGLTQGDKLPSQEQLIAMMGVSRTSLREAVKTLEAKGILTVLNGKGIYIADNHREALQFTLDMTEQKESLLELVDIRRALEREILRMAIQKATDQELEDLGKIKDVLLSKYYRGENQTSEDWQFHSTIYSFARNRTMAKLITAILEAIEIFWKHPLDMPDPFTETIPLHGELYNALLQRNVKLAQTINDEILDRVRMDIQNNM